MTVTGGCCLAQRWDKVGQLRKFVRVTLFGLNLAKGIGMTQLRPQQ
jgi:hypothetical protein